MTSPGGHEPQDRITHRPPAPDPAPAPMPVIHPDGVITPGTPTGAPAPLPPTTPPEQSIVAVLGDQHREGPWQVGNSVTVYSVLGDVFLDLRQAVLTEPTTTIRVFSVLGNLKVYTPPHVAVHVRGFTVLGTQRHRDESLSDAAGTPRPAPTHTVILQNSSLVCDVRVTVLDPGQQAPSALKRLKRLRAKQQG